MDGSVWIHHTIFIYATLYVAFDLPGIDLLATDLLLFGLYATSVVAIIQHHFTSKRRRIDKSGEIGRQMQIFCGRIPQL